MTTIKRGICKPGQRPILVTYSKQNKQFVELYRQKKKITGFPMDQGRNLVLTELLPGLSVISPLIWRRTCCGSAKIQSRDFSPEEENRCLHCQWAVKKTIQRCSRRRNTVSLLCSTYPKLSSFDRHGRRGLLRGNEALWARSPRRIPGRRSQRGALPVRLKFETW